jgi:hypothetical protein
MSSMSSLIETQEQRRARFLRLASEAADTAAKMPLPLIRLRYLELSETLKAEAEQVADESGPDIQLGEPEEQSERAKT